MHASEVASQCWLVASHVGVQVFATQAPVTQFSPAVQLFAPQLATQTPFAVSQTSRFRQSVVLLHSFAFKGPSALQAVSSEIAARAARREFRLSASGAAGRMVLGVDSAVGRVIVISFWCAAALRASALAGAPPPLRPRAGDLPLGRSETRACGPAGGVATCEDTVPESAICESSACGCWARSAGDNAGGGVPTQATG